VTSAAKKIVEIIAATGVWCHPHVFAANNEALKLLKLRMMQDV
jgi:hypothetical protein